MCRKLIFLTSLVCVLVLSGSAFAESGPDADLWVHPGDSCSISGTVTLDNGFYIDEGATLTITGTLTCLGDGFRPTINGGTLIVDGGNLNLPVRLNIGQPDGGTVYVINDGNMVQWDGGGQDSSEGIKFPDEFPAEGGVENRIFVLDGTLDAVLIEQKTAYDAKFIVGCNGTITVGETDNGWDYDPDRWLANGDLYCDPGCPGFIVITDLGGDVKQVICLQMPVATDPDPADGAPGECPSGLVLSWTPTELIAEPNHDVYLDSNSNDVAQATRASHGDVQYYSENQEDPSYTVPATLQVNTTYYWRVDEVDNTNPADPCVWESPVIWSFTTEDGNAFGPAPADGLRGWNPASPLTWTPSCAATAQELYLSTDFNDVNEMNGPIALGPAADNYAAALDPYTTYYWRVVTTGGGDAEVWTFKTGYGGLLLEMLFEGTQDTNLPATESDTSGNGLHFTTFSAAHHPDADGSVKYAGDVAVGTSAAFEPEAGLYRPDLAGPSGSDYLRLDGYQFSIHLWVKPADLSDNDCQRLVGKNTWSLHIHQPGRGDEANNNYRFDRPGSEVATLDDTAIEDEWIHIAVVYDQPDLSIYLNGVRVRYEESPDPVPDNNNPVGIGCSVSQQVDGNYPCNDFFEGSIDDLKIWDTVVVPVFGNSINPSPPHRARRLDPCDPNNTVLTWTPGPYADHHDVYFGTDANVVLQDTIDGNMYPEAGNLTLDYGKTYYWRVDDVNDGESITYQGFLWRFTMDSDSNLVVWYKFDELEDGDDVMDSSGNDLHGDADGDDDDTWDPNDGRFPGCIVFQEETRVDLDPDVLLYDYIGESISISVWWKDAWRSGADEENYFCAFGDDDLHMLVRAPDNAPDNPGVIWQAGNDTNDVLEWATNGLIWKDDWHHLVFTKNGPEGTMKIYFDTVPVASTDDAKGDTLSQAVLRAIIGDEDGFRIGAGWENDASFEGKADDFRVYDCEISQSKINELFRGGDLERAWAPDPFDGKPEVPRDATLIWRPGDFVEKHDVYLGTDWYDVNDADTTSDVYIGRETANSYDPTSNFALGTTYYWRIDEVNETDPDIWKGYVWSFTVANYIIIDSFESYTCDNDMWLKWIDWYYNGTGSTLLLSASGDPTHTGDKSMLYSYNNSYGLFYSEAERVLGAGEQDFTEAGVKVLTMYFYGKSTNTATTKEQLYAGLDDGGKYAEVRYGTQEGENITDIQIEDWTEWNVDLSDFTDVTLGSVDGLFIGFGSRSASSAGGTGLVFFDDIRISPPKCVAQYSPEYDFSTRLGRDNECTVDLADVGVMAEEWLRADACLPATAPGTGPVGWWKLEQNADDSSGNLYNGVAEGDYEWVAGKKDSYAVDLSGGWVYVADAGATPKLRPSSNTVSATAWIKLRSSVDDDVRIVVKGRNDYEGYGLEVNPDGGLTFLIRDPNGDKESVDSEVSLPIGSWVHCAGTYDGNNLVSYVDGDVDLSNQIGAVELMADANDGLGIGGRWGDTGDSGRFPGTIDEARVYDYGLSAANIAYVALGPSGYKRVTAMSNIYDKEAPGQKAVNFKDFALLMTKWLEKKLWPE